MEENKYHIQVARDETRSMGRYERLWYKGTARWFLLFGLFVLAGASVFLVYVSLQTKPQSQVAGTSIVTPVVNREFPHFYVVVNSGDVETLPASKNVWESAKSGLILRDGDALRTKVDAYATLLSNSDTIIRLAPNTEFQLLSVVDPSAKLSNVNVRVNFGSAWVVLSKRAGQKTQFMATLPHGFFTTDAGIFAIDASERERVSAIQGRAKVNVLAEAGVHTDAGIQNAKTHASEVAEGSRATLQPTQLDTLIAIEKFPSEFMRSYWYKWNSDQDSKYQSSLTNKLNTNAPPLQIDESSQHIVAQGAPFVVVKGETSVDARIFMNSVEVLNQGGSFSYSFSFGNHIKRERDGLHIVAMNRFGEQTSQDIVLEYFPDSQSAHISTTAGSSLTLTAESTSSGVALSWTGVKTDAKVAMVKSDTDANVSYPKTSALREFDSGDSHFVDSAVSDAKKYYYRVCLEGNIIDCSNVASLLYDASGYVAALATPQVIGTAVNLSWNQYVGSHFEKYVVVFAPGDVVPELNASSVVPFDITSATTTNFSTSELPAQLATGTWHARIALIRTGFDTLYSNQQTVVVP